MRRLQGALTESEGARLQAEEEIGRLEGETSLLRGAAKGLREEAALLRGETHRLHGEVDVLRGELHTLHSTVDTLRRQPLTRAMPVQYAALGLPRDFAANEALRESALGSLSGAAQRDERRAQLVAQRQTLMAEAEAETDAVRRSTTVQRLLALEWELSQV